MPSSSGEEHDLIRHEDWHVLGLRSAILPLVSRLFTRVFMGENLCRIENCLKIAANDTTDSSWQQISFASGQNLHVCSCPTSLRTVGSCETRQ